MKFTPKQMNYKEKAREYLEYLISKEKDFTLKENRKVRSQSQKGYLYVLFNQIVLETGCALEEVKYPLFKRTLNRDIFIRDGKFGLYERSSEDLDTKEMYLATERLRAFCSTELGIETPDPKDKERVKIWEAELSQYLSRYNL